MNTTSGPAPRFISPAGIGEVGQPAPIVSRSWRVDGQVASASLRVTAHGIYVVRINGERVGTDVLTPGWTSYPNRLRYQTYDVTSLVRPGENVVEVLLGNGWYRGRLAWLGNEAVYGSRLAAFAQLETTTVDGHVLTLVTDESWSARESHILSDDLYDGQTTDLRRRETPGDEHRVEAVEQDLSQLFAPLGPPVRPLMTLPAQKVWTSPNGKTLVDFGQNAAGWVRLRVRGLDRGREVTVRHAEVLENGELGVRPLRSAKATDVYILAGPDEVVLEPELTFHGFRYAEVSGIPRLRAEDIDLVVVSSDLERIGWFTCSDPMLNRLHDNVIWSMRGNFVDVPTDCPQRDERLGWTGDIQVFSPTAAFLFDVRGFLSSWLADLAAEQLPDGRVPHIVPNCLDWEAFVRPAAAWGDAATLVPWTLYQRYGDPAILERQWPSMKAWVDLIAGIAGPSRIWDGGSFQYGDWLDPDAPPDAPGAARAANDVCCTAYLARSAWALAEAAAVLSDSALETDVERAGQLRVEAEQYTRLFAEIRTAFAREFWAEGRIKSDVPTVYAMAIVWNLLDETDVIIAGDRLAELVQKSGHHISTGFMGTPLICDALSMTGHVDDAYKLLFQTECPSWLYSVTMGATTTWERWDSMLPDGAINPGQMTSFNHYALGAVADWMHRAIAGLAPAEPGYRKLLIAPLFTPELTHASARHLTPQGEAAVEWHRTDGMLTVSLLVPDGCTAEVRIPGIDGRRISAGEHTWEVEDPCLATRPV